jgi:hypothetical protein
VAGGSTASACRSWPVAAPSSQWSPVLIGSYLELVPLAATLTALRDLGVQILPSPSASGLLIALDAGGLLIAADPIRVDVARDASVLMTDGGSPEGTVTVNLF